MAPNKTDTGEAGASVSSIDTTDFLILKCLEDTSKPLWKNMIHEQQPRILGGKVSVQTVGRRVDKLRDEGMIDSCIVSPEGIKRDLIIAFKLTETGKDALHTKRRQLLLDAVQEEIFRGAAPEHNLDRDALIELIGDEFELGTEGQNLLHNEYNREELLTFLTLYYVKGELEDILHQDNVQKFEALAQHNDAVADVVQGSIKGSFLNS